MAKTMGNGFGPQELEALTGEDLQELTAESLKKLMVAVRQALQARKRIEAAALKAERTEEFSGKVKKGDRICFLFRRKETKGVVLKANAKTVTVRKEGVKTYIPYGNIVRIC